MYLALVARLLVLCSLPLGPVLPWCAKAEIVLPTGGKGEKKKKRPMAPQAIATAAQLAPGGTVQITLRVTGKRNQEVRYLIRSEPKLGKIVGIQPLDQEISVLTYQHTAPMAGEGDAHDRIVFAAQDDEGTSAPEEIAITIVDEPAALVAPDSVEFGEVLLSATVTRTITLANRGGHVLEGDFALDTPWRVEPSHFRLARGEAARFLVSFMPDSEREYRDSLRIATLAETVLHALAITPITTAPQTLDLVAKVGGKARSGNLTLTNRTAGDQTVRIQADPRLHLPAEIVVPANGTNTVAATLAADDMAGFDGQVEFLAGQAARHARIYAPPVGPSLFADMKTLSFGKLEVGRTKSLTLKLENRGGTKAEVTAEAPPPFQVGQQKLAVDPGNSLDLKVNLDPAWPGNLAANLRIVGSGADLTIPLTAEVTPRSPITRSLMAAVGTAAQFGAGSAVGSVEGKAPVFSGVPSIGLIEVESLKPTTATLAWKPPANTKTDLDYRLEFRRSFLDQKGAWHVEWLPISDVKFTKTSDRVTAVLGDLPSGYAITVRAMSVTAKGEVSQPSASVQFFVPQKPVIFTTQRVLLVLFGLLLVGALRVQRRLQKG
ncbi:MAG: choice-of-anchor D domain-containing protein [Verrucomicrobiota bacterium]